MIVMLYFGLSALFGLLGSLQPATDFGASIFGIMFWLVGWIVVWGSGNARSRR